MQVELNSLTKLNVFRPVTQMPKNVKHGGYKRVFAQKHNENNEIIKCKGRLVTQGFLQRLSIDYKETYFHIMNVITFCFLINLTISKGLDISLMDFITTYLNGFIDNDLNMKIPTGFKLPKTNSTKYDNMYLIKSE